MTKPRSFAPIIAAVLLLLPVLYVASYLALVVPSGRIVWVDASNFVHLDRKHYRWGEDYAATLFWPLEQIDRRLRTWGTTDPVAVQSSR